MGLEFAPWAVHGARHSAGVARAAQYAATGGAEGVGSPGDLAVKATRTPSNQVQVMPGGVAMLNRYAGGRDETYTSRVLTAELVDIPAAGSGGPRTTFVWARVIDPQFEGQIPAEPETAQYFFIQTGSRFPKNVPHLPLARITLPANTATVQQSMIEDLRVLASPKRSEAVFARPRIAADSSNQNWLAAKEPKSEYFPGGAGSPNQFQVDVPAWANRLIVDARWMGVRYSGGKNAWGSYWVEFGTEYRAGTWPNGQQFEFATQRFQFDSPGKNANTMRTDWSLMDHRYVPAKLRGKRVTFVFKAAMNAKADSHAVSMDAMSGLGMRLTFAQDPDVTWQDALQNV